MSINIQIRTKDHPLIASVFHEVCSFLLNKDDSMELVNLRFHRVMSEAVCGGKLNRLLQITTSYEITLERAATPEELRRAVVLGWVMEMFQSACLIEDDIIDGSQTRRQKPCWYKRVGMSAINDGLMLMFGGLNVLKRFLGDHPNFEKIMNEIIKMCDDLTRGESYDIILEEGDHEVDEHAYNTMVKFKTALYTFVTPIRLGRYLAGVNVESEREKRLDAYVEAIGVKIGQLYQVQDDCLDVFGDPEVTGKIGTDIIDGKYSWLYVVSGLVGTKKELKTLFSTYKSRKIKGGEREIIVKNLFKQQYLDEYAKRYEDQLIEECEHAIRQAEAELDCDFLAMRLVLAKISGRVK